MAFLACSRTASHISIATTRTSIPADGASEAEFTVTAADGALPELTYRVAESEHRATLSSRRVDSRTQKISLRAGVEPGPATLVVSGRNLKDVTARIELTPDYTDTFGDGTPDLLRLASSVDRDAFRRWFTLLAEDAAVAPSSAIKGEVADCAALLRFAYREALKEHDAIWASSLQLSVPFGDDVRKYHVPYTPLGPKLFRVRDGAFAASDIADGTFAEFADAKSLMRWNAHMISRDVHEARPGDLLFYRQLEQHSPFHSMVFVGRSHFGPGDDWVVYNTGRDGNKDGQMRRVHLRDLLQHHDARWRPQRENASFLGVYRWNILREAN